jgi:hypothetical protein
MGDCWLLFAMTIVADAVAVQMISVVKKTTVDPHPPQPNCY